MLTRMLVAVLACALVIVALPFATTAPDSGDAFMLDSGPAMPPPGAIHAGWLDWLRFGAAVVVAFITAWCSRDPAPGGC